MFREIFIELLNLNNHAHIVHNAVFVCFAIMVCLYAFSTNP